MIFNPKINYKINFYRHDVSNFPSPFCVSLPLLIKLGTFHWKHWERHLKLCHCWSKFPTPFPDYLVGLQIFHPINSQCQTSKQYIAIRLLPWDVNAKINLVHSWPLLFSPNIKNKPTRDACMAPLDHNCIVYHSESRENLKIVGN